MGVIIEIAPKIGSAPVETIGPNRTVLQNLAQSLAVLFCWTNYRCLVGVGIISGTERWHGTTASRTGFYMIIYRTERRECTVIGRNGTLPYA